eukprot:Gb_31845 [translate_table: standard]
MEAATDSSTCKRTKFSNEFLIPGLPNEVATLCLVRIPYIYHSSLRSVNSQWKNFVDRPSFYALRKELGFTTPSLFMLPKHPDELTNLPCWELDLNSHKSSKSHFHNNEAISERSAFGTDCVCVALGKLVMLVGGRRQCDRLPYGGVPISDVYIFDTLTKRWWRGPSMLRRRYRFGWGVIDGRLYVAGCSGDKRIACVTQSEVYDPLSNTWAPIARLPEAMDISISFVLKGRLFLLGQKRGQRKAFSYSPLQDQWQPETWLFNVYNTVPRAPTNAISCRRFFMTTTSESNFIYNLEYISAYGFDRFNSCSLDLYFSKYDSNTLQWRHVLSLHDQVISQLHRHCYIREAHFIGLNEKVLIVEHSESEEEDKQRYDVRAVEEGEVLRVSVSCPHQWFMAVVYA